MDRTDSNGDRRLSNEELRAAIDSARIAVAMGDETRKEHIILLSHLEALQDEQLRRAKPVFP